MYIVINNKKYDIVVMNSFFKRLKGLMFRKDPINKIYMFPRCSSIHTFFMRQLIDVCILDKDYIVTYKCSSIRPRRILIKKGYYTLEMPLDTSKYLDIGKQVKIKK
jgi:hypothetical protein